MHRRRESVAKGIGGIDFEDCYVIDECKRPVLALERGKGVTLTDVQGTIHVRNLKGVKAALGAHTQNAGIRIVAWP